MWTRTQQMQAKGANTWPSPPVVTVSYLVVAGGGGGGGFIGGGAGAGGGAPRMAAVHRRRHGTVRGGDQSDEGEHHPRAHREDAQRGGSVALGGWGCFNYVRFDPTQEGCIQRVPVH